MSANGLGSQTKTWAEPLPVWWMGTQLTVSLRRLAVSVTTFVAYRRYSGWWMHHLGGAGNESEAQPCFRPSIYILTTTNLLIVFLQSFVLFCCCKFTSFEYSRAMSHCWSLLPNPCIMHLVHLPQDDLTAVRTMHLHVARGNDSNERAARLLAIID